jgi:two-component sensor histidine kinase
MALLHEALYRSGTFAAVDLASYLCQLCNQAFRSLNTDPKVQLFLELNPVYVEMDQALPCGLLVNELICNCLKHAFPSGQAGSVQVRLEASDESIRIEVSDDGVGLPADLASLSEGSLGLQLVTDLAAQLDGVLQVEPKARFILVFPAKTSATSIRQEPGQSGGL